MKLAVFGLGYVGTVTAACLAANGHEVSGVDVDLGKVGLIRSGRSPVVEPGLDELVARTVESGGFSATNDVAEALEGADASLICVGTPSTSRGGTDLTYLRRAVQEIAAALLEVTPPASGRHVVIVRSTVPPGTVEAEVAPVLARVAAATGRKFGAAMCPEFLREGSGVADFFSPPFVVAGTADAETADLVTGVFQFLDRPVRRVEVRTAEALKYACNAFHATKVSFANEVGRLFGPFDVDTREVMALFCEDTALNISPTYLRPGFAFGGSCLPKDLRSMLHLARMNNVDLPLLAGALASNELCVRDVVDRVIDGDVRTVALLGLSFKGDTDDLRESPNVELAERLIGKGFEVRIFDPIVNPARLTGTNRKHVESRLPHLARILTQSAEAALRDADVAIVSSTDPLVVQGLADAAPPRVIDLTGRLGDAVESMPGYEGAGW